MFRGKRRMSGLAKLGRPVGLTRDNQSMLRARALAGFVFLFAVVAITFFGSAGTLQAQRAWATLALFFGSAGLISVWLWFHDKALLERRVKVGPGLEPDTTQNVIQALAGLVFLATFAVPGFDKRHGWSHVPLAVSFAGYGLMVIAFLIVFLTFKANSYTAGTVEIVEGQHVIDGGPYSVVRHPMYLGALVMMAGIPLGLGSWWGLIPAVLLVPAIVWRLLREEAFLSSNLAGYGEYRSRVRYRLAPLVW